jgi:hypothetical protein
MTASSDRQWEEPVDKAKPFKIPVQVKLVRVTGRAGSSGLFDEVTRPSAFGQTGHRADIAE